jgi:hypothetical protein
MPGGGCQGCAAPSGARPGLDAGALRHYIAKPPKEGGKTAAGRAQAEQARSGSRADAPASGGSPGRREEPPQESAGAAKPLTFRSASDPQNPRAGVAGRGKSAARAERSGAGAFRVRPLGGGWEGQRRSVLWSAFAPPTGGQHIAWQPSGVRGPSSGDGVSAAALTGPRAAAQTDVPLRPFVREPRHAGYHTPRDAASPAPAHAATGCAQELGKTARFPKRTGAASGAWASCLLGKHVEECGWGGSSMEAMVRQRRD